MCAAETAERLDPAWPDPGPARQSGHQKGRHLTLDTVRVDGHHARDGQAGRAQKLKDVSLALWRIGLRRLACVLLQNELVQSAPAIDHVDCKHRTGHASEEWL